MIRIGALFLLLLLHHSIGILFQSGPISYEADHETFLHVIPLMCDKISEQDCKQIIIQTAEYFNSTLTNLLLYESRVTQNFQNIFIVMSEDVDPRSTVFHLCIGRKATQSECSYLHHIITPFISAKFKKNRRINDVHNGSIRVTCSQDEHDAGLTYFKTLIGTIGGKSFHDILSPSFPFSGTDEKVVAFLEAMLRSNVQWPKSVQMQIIDIGAHEGGFIDTLNDALGNIFPHNEGSESDGWSLLMNDYINILSFEPTPSSFEILNQRIYSRRHQELSTQHKNIKLVRTAISNQTNKDGFIHCLPIDQFGQASSQFASLSSHTISLAAIPYPTEVWSLDDYLEERKHFEWSDSDATSNAVAVNTLLKIDVEGFDPLVLQGARKFLTGYLDRNTTPQKFWHPPKYILFEYNQAWTVACDSSVFRLETVVDELSNSGYQSYLLGSERMLRLDGTCWSDEYEFWEWSNVVAIQENEDDLNRGTGPNSQTISLLYSMLMAKE